jgi:hypothetical protein
MKFSVRPHLGPGLNLRPGSPQPAGLTDSLRRTHAERRFAGLGLRLLKLPHRADQRVCEVQAV